MSITSDNTESLPQFPDVLEATRFEARSSTAQAQNHKISKPEPRPTKFCPRAVVEDEDTQDSPRGQNHWVTHSTWYWIIKFRVMYTFPISATTDNVSNTLVCIAQTNYNRFQQLFNLWLAITNITYVDNDGVGVAGVRADDKLGIIIGPTLHNEVMKLVTKQVLARIVHVIAVTDHRHDAFRKPRQHVAVCFPFTITCPSRHCTTQSHTLSPYYTITHAVTVLINNKIKLHILGLPMNKLGNRLMTLYNRHCVASGTRETIKCTEVVH